MKITVLDTTLDKEQTKATMVNHKNSMIIAGAGSGKSLTIVGKIKYLVEELNIPLEEILCITFTNNAAKSLEEKIKKELNSHYHVYTFHKLALEILQEHSFSYKIAPHNLLSYIVDEIFYAIAPSSFFKYYFLDQNYLSSSEFLIFKKTIIHFIRLFIANYYEESEFSKIIYHASKKDKNLLLIIQKIYKMYQLEKASTGMIDFDDMIHLATKLIHEKGTSKHYQYIIIDEYQDTSLIRENLVREIQKKTHAFITVVGDDFQSIYRFSGCDVDRFLKFSIRFFPVKKLYLTNTYRNSQELIRVAGSFVMKNKKQIVKHLKSQKHILKPIIIFYYQKKTDLKKAIQRIPGNSLLILGRNNQDVYSYLGDLKYENETILGFNKNIYYKTIHKAKGLEEENVLLLNLTNDLTSLPSKLKDESLLRYIISKDSYPFEEERRLFYVALTRTKNYCYLFVPKKNPSIFVEELIRDYKKYITFIHLH